MIFKKGQTRKLSLCNYTDYSEYKQNCDYKIANLQTMTEIVWR